MAVKVQFEIGHAAKLKSKKTPEGFTHDWELFVRGIDKRDISQFVEKVVFNLHDSFPKPKRVIKEAPYVLKESGYAGFNLPIDIYFKNRDEPKRVTYNYDLSLQNTGPPATITQVKKFVFPNPSEEFRRKLLRGGGIPLVNAVDEKSRDSTDSQLLNKQKASTDTSKKHKIRPDDGKAPTFDTLFGPPITKTTTKVSPDPKNKNSPNVAASSKSKPSEKGPIPSSNVVASKEKVEKRDKREKHKHSSPHKDKTDTSSKDGRKSSLGDEKHERRDEKKKDKSHSKDRERSKDKNLKRPASPKRFSSPKATSPARSASAASRNDEPEVKASTRSNHSEAQSVSNSNTVEKTSTNNSSGSGSKKSKKEKKSHEKDKEREKKDKDRDRKEKDERSNNTNNISSLGNVNHSSNSNINAKVNVETKVDFNKKENNTAPQTLPKDMKDKKPVEPKSIETASANVEKKDKEKHDKEGEKKHKHKKKDKTKEREKDKDYASKDKKKDKPTKQKDDIKKVVPPPTQPPIVEAAPQKANPLNTLMNEISEGESSDSDNESHTTPSVTEKPENVVETSNSSMHDVAVTRPSPSTLEDTKTDKKERKSREKIKGEDRKRKRKSKEDNDSQTRKSVSPAIPPAVVEPPAKQLKKENLAVKRDKSMSPHIMTQPSAPPLNTILAPPVSKANTADDSAFRPPSATAPATAAGPSSTNNFQAVNHERTLTVDYMSELRELQKKIMTLQDNKELQQVVEMIAATGRFEITSKTFDFDLCALDRHTVQRLQDFFATSCS